jgi:hypothetical protein
MSIACSHCEKSFNSALALRGHSRVHADTYEASRALTGKAVKRRARARYLADPRFCEGCGDGLTYEQHLGDPRTRFCSHSCAARATNAGRTRSAESRARTAMAVQKAAAAKAARLGPFLVGRRRRRGEIVGQYSQLFRNRCAHCGVVNLQRTQRKYCGQHEALYGDAGRNRFEFTFNPFKYPDIFPRASLDELAAQGFWSPRNRKGLTRDHRVSVNQAIREGLDPYYIKHPMNCELMQWQANNAKKANSSMSYAELVQKVVAYDAAAGSA